MVKGLPSEKEIWKCLEEIEDPEVPALSIIDLKIVNSVEVHGKTVNVVITPTFVGCPALDMIAGSIQDKLLKVGFKAVDVKKNFAVRWSTDMLDRQARDKLEAFGIAPPSHSDTVVVELPTLCPHCKSAHTQIENPFGATLCKQLYYCNSCRQSFEKFKTL